MLLGVAVTLLAGCTRDADGDTPASSLASITIYQPTSGQTYASGDTVFADIHIQADVDLHGYQVFLINETASDTVWQVQKDAHQGVFHLDSLWINNVTDHSDMLFEVHAIIDHEGSRNSKSVTFHCHPL